MWMEEEVYDKNLAKEIKKRVAGKVDVQLGKKGITEQFIKEVKNRLEKHGVVKVKILKSFRRASELDRREIARIVAEKAGAKLLEVRGYTFILVKSKDKVKG
ncbi:MAG: YhbY family RNA-binding protein [Thermoprotei archaeon]